MNELRKRLRIISVRYGTPSRRAIRIIVAQMQDDLGNWMVPTITFDGPYNPIIESARYARDVAHALITAAYFYDEMMTYVSNEDAKKIFEDDANS